MRIIKVKLNVEELKKQLQENEVLQTLFTSNYIPDNPNSGERGKCKNGHFVFVSNYMPFEKDTHTIIKCDECEEVIVELKPYAVRRRELNLTPLPNE